MKLARLGQRIATLDTSRVRIEGSAKPANRDSLYGREWRKVRAHHLMANPLCVMCQAKGIVTMATVVDHIVPHRGDTTLFWEPSNHQSLCVNCHSSVKQAEETAARNGVGGV